MVNNSTCIKLKTTDQELAVVHQPVLASGDVGTTRVEYELDHFWDGYALTGTFYASRLPNEVYEQPLTAGACVIPWEVLQDPDILYIGLRGVNGDGLVKTAAPVRYRIIKGSPCGTDTPMEPTPDVYQQLLAKTDTLERVVEESTIVCEASGETVIITDASDQPLRGLKLYGKSVQNGTPTPENPVEIENAVVSTVSSVGVQLFDIDNYNVYAGYITEGYIKEFAKCKTVYIRCQPNTTYTVSKCLTARFVVGFTNEIPSEEVSVLNSALDMTGTKATLTANSPDNAKYIVIWFYHADYDTLTPEEILATLMVNEGTTALPYEPYKGGTATLAQPVTLPGIPVSSGGNYTDANGQQWICDEMDFGRGVYVQRVGKVDMGMLGWTLSSVFYAYITKKANNNNMICQMYEVVNNSLDTMPNYTLTGNNEYPLVYVKDSAYTDAATFKAAVSGVMLYYELATPVETPISETDLTAYRTLHTNKTNTTVYTDSNAGLTVAYAADTKTYIDNKFAELAAAVLQNA